MVRRFSWTFGARKRTRDKRDASNLGEHRRHFREPRHFEQRTDRTRYYHAVTCSSRLRLAALRSQLRQQVTLEDRN